jgi:hypothetical protein
MILSMVVSAYPVNSPPAGGDIGVFRLSNGNWFLDYNNTGVVNKTFHFGTTEDVPVIADWDGNGVSDAGVFRPSNGNWYLDTTKTGVVNKTFHFGMNGDIPVVGDWDGNGVSDAGVFRPSNGNWYLDTTKTGVVNKTFHFGVSGDIPVVGDWDGNGVSDAGVFRPSNGNWYLDTTKTGVVNKTFHFGVSGDIPVVGDWDGNGVSDAGVFRPSNGNWYLDTTKTGVVNKTFHFGVGGDIPVVGDWDGNGVSDAGVFRPSNGNWYLDTTKTGVVNKTFHFGTTGDIPIVGNWISSSAVVGKPPVTPTVVPTSPQPTPTPITPSPTPTAEPYGALSNPTGNPIGGGAGYSNIISQTDSRVKYIVSTRDQLLNALNSAKSGEVIFVQGDANIDLTGIYGTEIPGGVTLASNRGAGDSPGGRIFRQRLSTDPGPNKDRSSVSTLWIAGDNVRITGLRLEGPDLTTASVGGDDSLQYGIMLINNKGLEVDNCEIYGWSGAGVLQDTWYSDVTAGGLESAEIGSAILNVHHNYIHNCQTGGMGYGVGVYRNGAALIKGNIFDYTRHAVASDGWPNSGYEASYNVHLGHSTDHVFDVHGYDTGSKIIAGTLEKIHHNTIYVPVPKSVPWSVAIRGVPERDAEITYNDFPYPTYWGLKQTEAHDSPVTQYDFGGTGNVIVQQNLIGGVYSSEGPIKYCHQTSIGDFSCGYS